MTESCKYSTLLWIPLSGPRTIRPDPNYKQQRLFLVLHSCNNIAEMSELTLFCEVDMLVCGRWAQSFLDTWAKESPQMKGATVITTSGLCFTDNQLQALHHSLFLITSVWRSLNIWNEKNHCKSDATLFYCNLEPQLLFNSSPHGWSGKRDEFTMDFKLFMSVFSVLAEERVDLWYILIYRITEDPLMYVHYSKYAFQKRVLPEELDRKAFFKQSLGQKDYNNNNFQPKRLPANHSPVPLGTISTTVQDFK